MSFSQNSPIVSRDSMHDDLHCGRVFIHSGEFSLPALGVFDHLIVPTLKYVKLLQVMCAASGTPYKVSIHENPTVLNFGTIHDSFNLKRYSTFSAPTCEVYHTPTISATGTLLSVSRVDAHQGGGETQSQFPEMLLTPNARYLIRVQNLMNQVTDGVFHAEFIEESAPEPDIYA